MSDLLKEAQYYGKQTRNEAAERPVEGTERLRGRIRRNWGEAYVASFDLALLAERGRGYGEGATAERRATVERLDKVLAALVLPIGNDVAYTRGWDAAVDEARRLLAILDEVADAPGEAAR